MTDISHQGNPAFLEDPKGNLLETDGQLRLADSFVPEENGSITLAQLIIEYGGGYIASIELDRNEAILLVSHLNQLIDR